MSAQNPTTIEAIRSDLKADIEAYIESNRKRADSYLSLAMDIESMFEYAQSIHETDAETAESISKLATNLLPRWKEMTLIATDGRFEEAFSIYQYISLEVDLARQGHMRKHLQVSDATKSSPTPAPDAESAEPLPEALSGDSAAQDGVPLIDETFFDFLRDDVSLGLNQISRTLGKIIASKGEESDWKTLRLLCDSIKESSVVFGFNATIDIAEAAWQIAYAADQYPDQRTVEVAQSIVEVLQRYAELLELPFKTAEPDPQAGSNDSLLHRVSIRAKPVAAGLARNVTKPKLKVAQSLAKQTFDSELFDALTREEELLFTNDDQDSEASPLRLSSEEASMSVVIPTDLPLESAVPQSEVGGQKSEITEPSVSTASSTTAPKDEPASDDELPPSTQPMDQELRDLFRDEAAGYLTELAAELRSLRSSPQELSVWETVRRLCHTMKGSAAMVGMNDVSDEAWTAEQLAHTAIKEAGQRSSSRTDRLIRLISGIAKLLAVPFNVPSPDISAETPTPAVAPPLPKTILHAKAKAAPPANVASTPTAKPAATPPPKQTPPQPVQPAIQLPVQVSLPPPKKEAASIESTIDPELQNIFREEVSAFLKDLSLELGRLRRSEQDVDIWEIIKRLCNTIKGSALMVGLEDVSDEAWSAEQLAQTAIKEPAQRTTSRADRIVRITAGIAKKFGISFVVATPPAQATT